MSVVSIVLLLLMFMMAVLMWLVFTGPGQS